MEQNISNKKAAALKYDIGKDSAPKVTAKGKGNTALNIIKIAKENDIPIKEDPDLVELLSQIDLDREIPPNMYKAIAELFSYIYDISNKGLEKDKQLEDIISKK